jgi:cyclopropane-fatty-acyl-phospholipid synthase
MNIKKAKETFESLMDYAGIKVNGYEPHDIRVHNDDFYLRVLKEPALGLGETYTDLWWDCPAVDSFINKVLRADLIQKLKLEWGAVLNIAKSKIFNLQTVKRSFSVGEKHYDIGNDLYKRMLDRWMQYSCAYWDKSDTLEKAQEAKLDLVCRKLGLEPGMKVIELGCGFGGFARFAAKNYGVSVVGYTISKQQARFARQFCLGLPVEIFFDDYRNAVGKFDRVVSIGLMEHVGHKNYRTYMEKADALLKDNGISFVHTIGGNISSTICNPWTFKYIFPNSILPSIAQLGKAMEGLFIIEDLHNFGEDYDQTLMAWHANFKAAWPELKSTYSDRFYRMWEYYLLSCAGGFRSRRMQLWQMVMTKPGRKRPDSRVS